ncbi:hypothetical protein ABMA27_013696 [Loxostege sticticalis]|uniref:Uncharacterized protein n=1 Tax=Loxostege sticticalis TaxID=481309 RepID=A0ABR3IB70_LOXSC
MISKFLRPSLRLGEWKKLALHRVDMKVRRYAELIPPNQYDLPFPPRLQMSHVLRVYWETIPLFISTLTAIGFVIIAIIYSARNKVDVVFSSHSRENISRTMDLRSPTIHKLIIINQRYEPWPEMADLLDRMNTAEKRVMNRVQACSMVA